jgi:hypothetical protein
MYQMQKSHEAHLSALHDLTGEEAASPNKSFSVARPKYTEDMDLSALIAACEEVCKSLDSTVKTDVLSVPTATSSPLGDHTKSTVR